MEEILASIRKIISEDTPEVAAPSAEAPKPDLAPVADAEPDIEVLELTQEIVETPEPITMSEPFQPADEPVAAKPDDVVFETPQAVAKPEAAHGEGEIFSDQTRKAMDEAFESIDHEPQQSAPSPRQAAAAIAPVDGASIENVFERAVRESFEPVLAKYLSDNSGAVIERMKPLIREWMDEHFPALLEGAVRTEIERVVRARGKR
jgi:cell pole-organizing protein PopZ